MRKSHGKSALHSSHQRLERRLWWRKQTQCLSPLQNLIATVMFLFLLTLFIYLYFN
jgi:hypothetical protein